MNDKKINKFIFKLQPNSFLKNSSDLRILNNRKFDPYFIQYIIDKFRYIFSKTLGNEDIESADGLIGLLEKIRDLNISDIIDELKNNPKNRNIQNILKQSLENKKYYIKSINKIIKKKHYFSRYVNPIYEIGHRFILEDYNKDPFKRIEEQPYFEINYLEKIYKTDDKFTAIKPVDLNKIQKIYFNSPDKLYTDAINGLKQIKVDDTLKLIPQDFSNDKIEPKKILNSRKERNADLRRFICFLDFYLKETQEKEDYKTYGKYYIFIIFMFSPFADYIANNMKYSKERLELSINKSGLIESNGILASFNIIYDDDKYINDDDKKSKASKEFFAFFNSYLTNSKKLKSEYEKLKKDFEKNREHYKKEIEKFDFNYEQKKDSYESGFPFLFADGVPAIIRMEREFPPEEADNISIFLDKQISSLYKNKKAYLLIINDDYSPISLPVPKIIEIQKPFKYISESEIKEFRQKLCEFGVNLDPDINEKEALNINIYIAEYFLPPNRHVKYYYFVKNLNSH